MKLLYVAIFTIQLLCVDAESEPVIEPDISVLSPPYPIDCNNPEVLVAADFTLRKFNAEQKSGHQYALDQVQQAEAQGLRGRRYFIKFSIQETDCSVGNEKIWKDCSHKAQGEAATGHCVSNVYIHKTDRIVDVAEYNCSIDSDHHTPIVPKRGLCLGCPVDLPTDHHRLNETIALAIAKFNTESNHTNYFQRDRVYKFTRQVVAGIKYVLKFSIQETECSKEDSDDLPPDCDAKADGIKLYCNSQVYFKSWMNSMNVFVDCNVSKLEIITFAAPRYVGWGPFSMPQPPRSHSDGNDTHPEKLTSAEQTLADSLESPKCPGKPWRVLLQHISVSSSTEQHHDNNTVQTAFRDLGLLDF
ncbi:hypothetical protein chiPu_0010896 [Chiloscyllium punctatum]|uniref:Cystatin kininogen-type domain-containing protein n=1 Tax=Chiloscyllium punctatum TaxID=137246 RepID=A0A401SPV4_CHIPU|nr:hypothetical protein [Chiloscyllium punctatum]